MVIHNFYVFGTHTRPAETHAELVVHADAMRPGSITLEHRRTPQPPYCRSAPKTPGISSRRNEKNQKVRSSLA